MEKRKWLSKGELAAMLLDTAGQVNMCLSGIKEEADRYIYVRALRDSCESVSGITRHMYDVLRDFPNNENGFPDYEKGFTSTIADDLRECAGTICDYAEYMRMDTRCEVPDEEDTNRRYGYDADHVYTPWDCLDKLKALGEEMRDLLEPLRVADDFTNERIAECWEACKADLLARGHSRVGILPVPDRCNPDRLDWTVRFDIRDRTERDVFYGLEDAIEKFFSLWFVHDCHTFIQPTYICREGYTQGFRFRPLAF